MIDRAVNDDHRLDAELGAQRRWYVGPLGYVLRDVYALRSRCHGAAISPSGRCRLLLKRAWWLSSEGRDEDRSAAMVAAATPPVFLCCF